MKKLKPIHWILIAVILIEAIVLGVWFGGRSVENSPTPTTPTELLLNYTANEDGSFTLLSMLQNAEDINVSFTYNDKTYTYDTDLVTFTEAYQNFEKYQELEPDATKELWEEFQNYVSGEVNQHVNKQHASIEYIRNIAKSGYSVPHEQLYENRGLYTINATTTIDNWNAIFADYILTDEAGNTVNELALGATIRIGETDYRAMVYTIIHSDNDNTNNHSAQEVAVHILFGDHMLSDITLSDATIYYLKPDGSEYFAHSKLKVTYTASSNEARYRDILILGGLQ